MRYLKRAPVMPFDPAEAGSGSFPIGHQPAQEDSAHACAKLRPSGGTCLPETQLRGPCENEVTYLWDSPPETTSCCHVCRFGLGEGGSHPCRGRAVTAPDDMGTLLLLGKVQAGASMSRCPARARSRPPPFPPSAPSQECPCDGREGPFGMDRPGAVRPPVSTSRGADKTPRRRP